MEKNVMCGIAGFCDFKKNLNKKNLQTMTDVLYRRGPDDSGYNFFKGNDFSIGLGHRRLSILDLSHNGHQPMSFDNLEIVYNGEIYNFNEIRKELEEYDYIFNSSSDTEVVLKAYHKWGIKAVDKFNGMFAICLYNKKENKLVFIRDRSGVKPLYYYYKNDIFLFSSELKSFYTISFFQKYIKKNSIRKYLKYGYIPQPMTIFEDTFKLEAGKYLELDLNTKKINIQTYWCIDRFYNKKKLDISLSEAIQETEKLLISSFEYRMVSDVPIGVFLSGGYDSSVVTAILQSQRREKLKTFTIGFHEKKYNEAPYAKEVAEHLGTDHTEYYCTQKDALEIIQQLVEIYDEPFGDSSAIPPILGSNLAKKDVKVTLSADGGDEIFSGYPSYKNCYDLYNKFQWFSKFYKCGNIDKVINPYQISKYLNIYNLEGKFYKFCELLKNSKSPSKFYNTNTKYFYDIEIEKLLNAKSDSKEYFQENNIDNMLIHSFKTYLNNDILTKVDRATMSASLEGREPMLDHRLIEFVAQLPIQYKQKRGETKYNLKKILHKYIPKKIMERKKMGFSIPIFEWFKDELEIYFEEYLSKKAIEKSSIFDYGYIQLLKNSYYQGYGNPHKLWLVLIFQMWWFKWIK